MATTSTFTTNPQLNADTNPKDVGYLLATTVDEQDAVVFTKTSLVQFLKLYGVQVDTNYTELKRLPKYATFGKLSKPTESQPSGSSSTAGASSSAAPAAVDDFTPASNVRDSDGKEFRPTRRVREAIGGGSAQISALFGSEDSEAQDARTPVELPQGTIGGSSHKAASTVPGRPHGSARDERFATDESSGAVAERARGPVAGSQHNPISTVPGRNPQPPVQHAAEKEENGPEQGIERSRDSVVGGIRNTDPTVPSRPPRPPMQERATGDEATDEPQRGGAASKSAVRDSTGREFRPTRRVREAIGGGSEQIASLFGGDVGDEENTPVGRK